MSHRRRVLCTGVILGTLGCATDVTAPTGAVAMFVRDASISAGPTNLTLDVTRAPHGDVRGGWTEDITAGSPIRVRAVCAVQVGSELWLSGTISDAANASLVGLGATLRLAVAADGTVASSLTALQPEADCRARPQLRVTTGTIGRINAD